MAEKNKMASKIEDFEVIGTIGFGSFGTVRKVVRIKDKQVFAWKEVNYSGTTEAQKEMLVNEVNLLKSLQHENIVKYVDKIVDRRKQICYLVMEYCEGGDLASFIARSRKEGKRMDEMLVWRMAYQLATALKKCHSSYKHGKSVLHRDLKPANVFLDGQLNVKLGDFGLAKVLSDEGSLASTFVGTPLYMSPEQVRGRGYNSKSDMWSLGCILYELCCLRPPFTAANQPLLTAKICQGNYDKLPAAFTPSLTSLIYSLLTVEMDKRPGINELLENKGFIQFKINNNNNNNVDEIERLNREMKMMREVVDRAREKVRRREEDVELRENNVRERLRKIEEKEEVLKQRENSLIERLCKYSMQILTPYLSSADELVSEYRALVSREQEMARERLIDFAIVKRPKPLQSPLTPPLTTRRPVNPLTTPIHLHKRRLLFKTPSTFKCVREANGEARRLHSPLFHPSRDRSRMAIRDTSRKTRKDMNRHLCRDKNRKRDTSDEIFTKEFKKLKTG